MRVDKWLWNVRIYKTRSIASSECKRGRVKIDGLAVKQSRVIKKREVIQVSKPPVNYYYEIIDFPKNRVGAKLVDLYLVDITPDEELKKLKILNESKKMYNRKGIGRPTKKDRRNLQKINNRL